MDQNYFRLENLIYIPATNQIARITAIRKNYGVWVNDNVFGALGFSEIEPVKLTKKILLQVNFEQMKTYIGIELSIGKNLFLCYKKGFFTVESTTNVLMKIKGEYLHELQNLYFALTNSELPIDYIAIQ